MTRVPVWLLAALAVGCGGPSGPTPASLPSIPDAQQVRLLWSADIGTAEYFTLAPILAGDSV